MIPALRRSRFRTWEWAALTCPHRSHLRRYRWSLAVYAVIRVGPAWVVYRLRSLT
ncbi:MAG: hypothetical protein HOZ81_05060 [Streptomyces sp.]|nr:hypothetical protein [Streptomyces sp.]